MYSGFPADGVTEDDKTAYVQQLQRDERIELQIEEICNNAGAHSVAKLRCNTMWAKRA